MVALMQLSPETRANMRKLFLDGPSPPNDLEFPAHRDEIVLQGLAYPFGGWLALSYAGLRLSIEAGFDVEKDQRSRNFAWVAV